MEGSENMAKKKKKFVPTEFMAEGSHYDEDQADYVVNFIQCLCHTKGKWAGKPFLLLPWQEEIIRNLFGILKADGKRQFTTAYGETITVSGGDYGWVIAPNDTTTKILDAIKSGESQTITPEYTYSAYRREKDEIGNTYVEISLSRQHMWFFKDGQLLVSTDIVTGNHNRGWDTHTGVYAIMYKERDATLVGEGYNSSVTYWMPFYANTGIHDATWRSSFGGSIYMNNGSHGCINTPYDQAEKIFNNIEKGVPVVVYN